MINDLSKFSEIYSEKNTLILLSDKKDLQLNINDEFAKKIFIESIQEYINLSEKEIEIITDYDKVNNFINKKIKNNETINKKISSYTVKKINLNDLQKSIKDNYIKKQIYGTKNIIELSNEAKQEKINLRFDLYK